MKIKYVVVCVYEDESKEDFETFGAYEEAENWIMETKYSADYWQIEKRYAIPGTNKTP